MLSQWWNENSWHYWTTNKYINVKEKDEQRFFMKRDSTKTDATSLTWFRKKTLRKSRYVHSEECARTEEVNAVTQQAATDARKHTFIIENYVVSKHNKRWNYNEEIVTSVPGLNRVS